MRESTPRTAFIWAVAITLGATMYSLVVAVLNYLYFAKAPSGFAVVALMVMGLFISIVSAMLWQTTSKWSVHLSLSTCCAIVITTLYLVPLLFPPYERLAVSAILLIWRLSEGIALGLASGASMAWYLRLSRIQSPPHV